MFDIELEHPEYVARKATWKTYRDLYVGGDQFRASASEYLVGRQREPREVFGERLNRVFYENYIGSIVDWYASTLFRREPNISSLPQTQFYSEFMGDCDRKGTCIADFFRGQFIETLIAGTSYVLVDFPRAKGPVGTRGEEDALGVSRAYLVPYAADQVINWSKDDLGNFDWVVIRSESVKKARVDDAKWRTETRWAFYDRTRFQIYRRADKGEAIVLEDQGQHGLAKLEQVPLFGLRIPEGLWMVNRAGSLQLEHFNKSNALSWALTMGLFAMPVVYSEREWSQMVGESYYIQLGPEDRFGWTEPEGKVFQIAQDNLSRLQEEIYRVCYLTQQGAALDVGGRQSALAKQRDFSHTQEVLRAYTTIRAEAMGGVLSIYSRELGTAGEAITVAANTDSTTMTIALSGSALAGGVDGVWRTDLTSTPRLNRAMRDWTRSFVHALNGYGIDAACAFSTEIKHGDPSVAAGIAQRDVEGNPILLPTPALQANFSPTSLDFWKQVHADCAQVMNEAGIIPYLQFGEEQWWYFPHDGRNPPDRVNFASMPFYDAWTTDEFFSRYDRSMTVFSDSSYDPAHYPDEMAFLSNLLGEFTDAVMEYVRTSYPTTRFEVLYPFDVNGNPFNKAFNFPVAFWTSAVLDCLKTEGLSLTFTRNLAASESGMDIGESLGFESSKCAHLVGLGDSTAPWLKEMRIATGRNFESVVGFALDQFCLVGYEVPFPQSTRRAVRIRR